MAVHAINRVPIEPGTKVVVIGSGPIGLTIAEMANFSGAGSVMVVGLTAPPLARINSMIGALTVDAAEEDVLEAVKEWTDGQGADVVFDAVGGHSGTLKQAITLTRPGGHVGMVGGQISTGDLPLGYAQSRELSLHGIYCYGRNGIRHEFEVAIDLLATDKLKPEPLITHRYPLSDLGVAFSTADARVETGSIKVIVNP